MCPALVFFDIDFHHRILKSRAALRPQIIAQPEDIAKSPLFLGLRLYHPEIITRLIFKIFSSGQPRKGTSCCSLNSEIMLL